jgi:hypothetical protein
MGGQVRAAKLTAAQRLVLSVACRVGDGQKVGSAFHRMRTVDALVKRGLITADYFCMRATDAGRAALKDSIARGGK